jgi:hypothetical protein
MKFAVLSILFVAILFAPFHLAFTEEPSPDAALQAKIKALVEQLGADDSSKRDAAAEELIKIGPPAKAALEDAVKAGNAAAKEVVEAITIGVTLPEMRQVNSLIQEMRMIDRVHRPEKGSPPAMGVIETNLGPYLPDVAPLVEPLLDDKNVMMRYNACYLLSRVQNKKALEEIDRQLKEFQKYDSLEAIFKEDAEQRNRLVGLVDMLNFYRPEDATPVAEKYLKKPYIEAGILRCGVWTEKHYEAFVSLLKDGCLGYSEVQDYLIKYGDASIAQYLTGQLKKDEPSPGLWVVLAKLAPTSTDVKQQCLKYIDSGDYYTPACNVLADIAPEVAAKAFREKIAAYIQKAPEGNAQNIVRLMTQHLVHIEGEKSVDVLEALACTDAYQGMAVSRMSVLPSDVAVPALERVLAQCREKPRLVLMALAKAKYGFLARALEADMSYREYASYDDYLRMVVGIDEKNIAQYLAMNLGRAAEPPLQLKMVGIIAAYGDKSLLAEVEKAVAGFKEQDMAFRKAVYDEELKRFEAHKEDQRQVGGGGPRQPPIRNLDAEVAEDMFRLALYLNMLGKDNLAELRDYVIKHELVIPYVVMPAVRDGKMTELQQGYMQALLYLVKNDSTGKLKTKMKEIVKGILDEKFRFDDTVEWPRQPAPRPLPSPGYNKEYWTVMLRVLIDVGEKDEMKAAVELLQKHAAHPTDMLFSVANALRDYDKAAVVKFLIDYFQAPPNKRLGIGYDGWWEACRIASLLTGREIRYPRFLTRDNRAEISAALIEALKKIKTQQ